MNIKIGVLETLDLKGADVLRAAKLVSTSDEQLSLFKTYGELKRTDGFCTLVPSDIPAYVELDGENISSPSRERRKPR